MRATERQVPEKLIPLAQRDPIVHACMVHYMGGDVSLEEALVALAVMQTESKENAMRIACDAVNRYGLPHQR